MFHKITTRSSSIFGLPVNTDVYHLDPRPLGRRIVLVEFLRAGVHGLIGPGGQEETLLVEPGHSSITLIEGDGRRPDFKVHAHKYVATHLYGQVIQEFIDLHLAQLSESL